MINQAAHVTLTNLRQIWADIGLTFPKSLGTALDAITAAETKYRAPGIDVGERLLDCLDEGRDPFADPELQRAAVSQYLANAGALEQMQRITDARIGVLLGKHTNVLLKQLASAVANADETLRVARAEVPGLDVDAPNSVTALEPAKMQHWGDARNAVRTIEQAVGGWKLLARHANVGVHTARQPLIVADLDLDALERLRPATVEAVIRSGHPLSLAATFDEAAGRVAAVEAEEKRRRDAARAKRIRNFA